jgi:hypothetical protein
MACIIPLLYFLVVAVISIVVPILVAASLHKERP